MGGSGRDTASNSDDRHHTEHSLSWRWQISPKGFWRPTNNSNCFLKGPSMDQEQNTLPGPLVMPATQHLTKEKQNKIIVVFRLLSCVRLFETSWTAACQDSLSFTLSWEFAQTHVYWVDDAINHLILCCPRLLLPSIFPSIWDVEQKIIVLWIFN